MEILFIVSSVSYINFRNRINLPLEPDDKVDLGLSSDVEVTGLPGLSL